jgi:hypothetical protein
MIPLLRIAVIYDVVADAMQAAALKFSSTEQSVAQHTQMGRTLHAGNV